MSEFRFSCRDCPFKTQYADAAKGHEDYLKTNPRGWLGHGEEHRMRDNENSWERARREREEAQDKLRRINNVIAELGDPEYWTKDQLDTAIETIADIIDPEDPDKILLPPDRDDGTYVDYDGATRDINDPEDHATMDSIR